MPDLAAALNTGTGARLRTGRVVRLNGPAQIVVDLGGGELVDMPTLTTYPPILGDAVQILQQGAVSFALGRTAIVAGDNTLQNGSFEQDPPGTTPTGWTAVAVTGAATTTTATATGWGAATGSQWLKVAQNGTGPAETYAISNPIPVTPGERWTAAAHAVNVSIGANGACGLYLAWHAAAADIYPTTVSVSPIAALPFPAGGIPGWALLRELSGGGRQAPAGATYLRVMLGSTLAADPQSAAYWDAIICRRLSGV